jgi:hypothetical protein
MISPLRAPVELVRAVAEGFHRVTGRAKTSGEPAD